MVSDHVPFDACRLTDTVIREVVDVVLDGENDALTRFGSPVTDSETLPLNPFCRVIVTVYEFEVPRLIVCDVGAALSEKSAGLELVTTSVAGTEWLRVPPLIPLIVNG
jgi:hypothetical protein